MYALLPTKAIAPCEWFLKVDLSGRVDVAMYMSRLYTWRRIWPRFSAQARLVRAKVYVRLGTNGFVKPL